MERFPFSLGKEYLSYVLGLEDDQGEDGERADEIIYTLSAYTPSCKFLEAVVETSVDNLFKKIMNHTFHSHQKSYSINNLVICVFMDCFIVLEYMSHPIGFYFLLILFSMIFIHQLKLHRLCFMQSIARRYRSHPHKMPFSIYADSFQNGDGQFEFPDPLTKLGFLAEFSKTASNMNQSSDLIISLY